MKTFRFIVTGLVSIFCLSILIVSSAVEASEYLGEFCWDVVWDDRPNYVMKLGVTDMGGGYYIVQSDMENVNEQDFGGFFGAAQIVGNQIRVSVQETHSDGQPIPTENADHSGCQWFLDATTLNGSGWCTTAHYELPSNNGAVYYSTGTLTYIPCPTPSTPCPGYWPTSPNNRLKDKEINQ